MPDACGGPMPGWNGRERVHETLYMRGARASLLTGAGVLSALWLPDSARVHHVKGARSGSLGLVLP